MATQMLKMVWNGEENSNKVFFEMTRDENDKPCVRILNKNTGEYLAAHDDEKHIFWNETDEPDTWENWYPFPSQDSDECWVIRSTHGTYMWFDPEADNWFWQTWDDTDLDVHFEGELPIPENDDESDEEISIPKAKQPKKAKSPEPEPESEPESEPKPKKTKKPKKAKSPEPEESDDSSESSNKKTKKKKERKDRKPSTWDVFRKEEMKKVKAQYPDERLGDWVKRLSAQWKGMSDEEKAAYMPEE